MASCRPTRPIRYRTFLQNIRDFRTSLSYTLAYSTIQLFHHSAFQYNKDHIIFQRIDEKAQFSYKRVLVPEDMSANMLCINGHIVCKSKGEAPKSFEILQQQLGNKYKIIGLDLSEIEKAVGSLTCMSLRFNKPTAMKPAATKQLVCRYEEME